MHHRSSRRKHHPTSMDKPLLYYPNEYKPNFHLEPTYYIAENLTSFPTYYNSRETLPLKEHVLKYDKWLEKPVSFHPVSYKGLGNTRVETPPTVAERALKFGRWSENPLKTALSYHDSENYPAYYIPRETELDQKEDRLTGKRRRVKRSFRRRSTRKRMSSRK